MGVEQGDYIEYGGGSGDYGGMDYGGEVAIDFGGYGGGGGDFVLDPGFGLDLPDNLSPGGDAIAWGDIGAGDDFTYGYGTEGDLGPVADSINWGNFGEGSLPDLPFYQGPSFEDIALTPAPSLSDFGDGTDLFGAFFDYYSAQGYDDYTAMQLAAQDAAAGSILTETLEQAPPPNLPNLPDAQFFPLPYVTDYWQSPPYVPTFYELPVPPPPPPPTPPVTTSTPKLPPACAGGTYHPYPIGHPQQDICVPFPPASKPPSQQQSKPPAQQPKSPAQQQKPPAQQQACATGYCKHPTTGQCIRIPQGYYRHPQTQVCTLTPRCTTPGTVLDQRTGLCVPFAQAQQPGCPTGYWPNPETQRCELIPQCQTPGTVFDVNRGLCVPESELSEPSAGAFLDELGKLPWWLWAALAAALLLGSKDDAGSSPARRRTR